LNLTKVDIILNLPVELSLYFDLKKYIATILDITNFNEGSFEFSFIFDKKMIDLNTRYFNKNNSTDIITFNLNTIEKPHADIYICVDEAKRNATEHKKSLDEEIQLLIIHGILHIKGYEDYDDRSRSIMFEEQDKILKKVADL
tara:strand:+ start:1061 stop:1489 length:429 start_codon:yes stop_codon:yes gene_type:complete